VTWLAATEIETASGLKYDFLEPDVSQVKLDDIAHGLSQICRFAGHTTRFYSVAEHSVLVSKILEATFQPHALAVAGLFHDAHEAYVGDVPRPMKHLVPGFEKLADIADRAIAEALDLDEVLFHATSVKDADLLALFNEGEQLMPVGPSADQRAEPLPAGLEIVGHAPPDAYHHFVNRVEELRG
jgi:hypothetical protein